MEVELKDLSALSDTDRQPRERAREREIAVYKYTKGQERLERFTERERDVL